MAYHPFRHLGLKFLSVAIAVALWFTVAGEQTVERTLRVPLAFQNQPDALELVDNPPDAVDVRVRGAAEPAQPPRRRRRRRDGRPVRPRAPGRSSSTSRQRRCARRSASRCVQVTPGDDLAARSSRRSRKVVPVAPAIEGEPAPGYVGREADASTRRRSRSSGPRARCSDLEVGHDRAGVGGRRARSGARDASTSACRIRASACSTPTMATVTVPIAPVPVERLVQNVPVRLRGVGPRGSPRRRCPAVVVGRHAGADGRPRRARRAARSRAFVDLAGLGPGRYNLPVRVEPPQNVEVVQTDPATVRVRIR